ncbi:MAG: hypothetical protein KAR85_07120 [Methanosarcinales archaeon]|nr:hypothetical protein [Methanosarcinales archaeon]
MGRKKLVLLIAIIAVALMTMFSGCVEETGADEETEAEADEETNTSTETDEETNTSTETEATSEGH